MKRSRRKRKKGPGSLDDLIFLLKSNPKTYPSPRLAYRKKTYFFNTSERKFFQTLSSVLPPHYLLFSKVRLLDLFDFPKGDYTSMNKIKAKHVDFLICDKIDVSPLLAIELDGWSHQAPDRQARDREVDTIFISAKLPLVHIEAGSSYNPDELSAMLRSYLVPQLWIASKNDPGSRVSGS